MGAGKEGVFVARKRTEGAAATVTQSPPRPEAQPAEDEHKNDGAKPVKTFRIGRLWCNIWENYHAEKGTWYSSSITRSYRDKQNRWQSSHNMGKDDLLPFGELARMAFHWINETQQREFELSEG